MLREAILKIHLYLGLAASAVLVTLGGTGAVLGERAVPQLGDCLAAGELPGQAAARLASWATAGGAVARGRQQTSIGGGTATERVS